MWVSFRVSVAIQVNAGGNKPEDDPSCFEKKSSSSYLIYLCYCSLGLHSASIHHLNWIICVNAVPGFALPLEGCGFGFFF